MFVKTCITPYPRGKILNTLLQTTQYSKCAIGLVSNRILSICYHSSVVLDIVYKYAFDTRSNLCGTGSKMVIETTMVESNLLSQNVIIVSKNK